MDDDFGWAGGVEVRSLRPSERLVVEHLCTVHVFPGQQQVLDPQFDSVVSVLLPCGVVEVSTLIIPLTLLYTWEVQKDRSDSIVLFLSPISNLLDEIQYEKQATYPPPGM